MNHKELDVWKRSMDLAESIYRISERFPAHENYGLTSQMRRAAVSIPSNLAEGFARKSMREFLQFLNISLGSLSELETQVLLAKRLHYIEPDNTLEHLIINTRRLLLGTRNHIMKQLK